MIQFYAILIWQEENEITKANLNLFNKSGKNGFAVVLFTLIGI